MHQDPVSARVQTVPLVIFGPGDIFGVFEFAELMRLEHSHGGLNTVNDGHIASQSKGTPWEVASGARTVHLTVALGNSEKADQFAEAQPGISFDYRDADDDNWHCVRAMSRIAEPHLGVRSIASTARMALGCEARRRHRLALRKP